MNFKVFDATTKFPVGTLLGSTFDLGNFDECVMVDVKVGKEEVRMRGQYCLAKITYDRIVSDAPVSAIDLRNLEHLKYANTSTWSKIENLIIWDK
ncbi:hypothetical protein J437_LFUL003354 [Ladona fulva]|uniref:Nose resistant-to-fluoxetine protein N-terminal domain-containing protein n=1 Tax=Ladona fulva TaxID=123851 RepID=A0A8K0NWX1_LADFU|nr:hypothetical protein J437_LFUL003354 [Ladona fulva]